MEEGEVEPNQRHPKPDVTVQTQPRSTRGRGQLLGLPTGDTVADIKQICTGGKALPAPKAVVDGEFDTASERLLILAKQSVSDTPERTQRPGLGVNGKLIQEKISRRP